MLFMWNIDDSPCASKTEFCLRKRYFLDKREIGYNEEKFDILRYCIDPFMDIDIT